MEQRLEQAELQAAVVNSLCDQLLAENESLTNELKQEREKSAATIDMLNNKLAELASIPERRVKVAQFDEYVSIEEAEELIADSMRLVNLLRMKESQLRSMKSQIRENQYYAGLNFYNNYIEDILNNDY